MKKLRWPLLIVLLALAVIAVLLLSQPDVLLPVPPDEIKPVTGGIYSEALTGSLNRLNPLLDAFNQPDHDLDRLLFSGLIKFDEHGLPQGDLAESWGISQDGKVYNFSLRPNAVWHDGKPVTSADILFTIDLMRSEDSLLAEDVREMWDEIEVVDLDEKMIQFHLPEPFAPFLDYLSFGILPQHKLEGITFQELVNDRFNLEPVGSGPYRLGQILSEAGQVEGVQLVAFKDYYGQKPYIQELVFRYYPDPQAALAAYQQGEVMGIGQITTEILPAALKEPELEIHTSRLPQLSLIFLNQGNPDTPFFGDPAVRRALLLGLNRQWIVDRLLNGQAILADGPVLPGSWAYYEGVERVPYDSQAAIDLLKEAGYTFPAEGGEVRANADGVRLEFTLVYPDDEAHEALAQAIQQDWQKLGVGIEIAPQGYEALVSESLNGRTFQAALVDLNLARTPDPDPYPFWHQTQTKRGQNYSAWNDHQASEYLERARISADTGERAQEYRNFQVRFSQELPALPLYFPVYSFGVSSQVQGVSVGPLFDPSDRHSTLAQWYLQSRRATEAAPTEALETPTP